MIRKNCKSYILTWKFDSARSNSEKNPVYPEFWWNSTKCKTHIKVRYGDLIQCIGKMIIERGIVHFSNSRMQCVFSDAIMSLTLDMRSSETG